MTELEWRIKFSNSLKREMKYRHMSSTKLSELSGVTYRCIKHYLDGTRTPSIKSLINISNALGCDIRDIADLDGFIE